MSEKTKSEESLVLKMVKVKFYAEDNWGELPELIENDDINNPNVVCIEVPEITYMMWKEHLAMTEQWLDLWMQVCKEARTNHVRT